MNKNCLARYPGQLLAPLAKAFFALLAKKGLFALLAPLGPFLCSVITLVTLISIQKSRLAPRLVIGTCQPFLQPELMVFQQRAKHQQISLSFRLECQTLDKMHKKG